MVNNMRKLLTYILLFISLIAFSQNGTTVASGLPYECSFEESENLTPWRLNYNAPANAVDKWIFGTAVHSEGKRAMYISTDNANPNYGSRQNISIAYLRYRFPASTTRQKYDISFDWKGMGDSTKSKLYVMIDTEDKFTNASVDYSLDNLLALPNGRIVDNLTNPIFNNCQPLTPNGDRFVCGSETWQNISFSNEVSVSSANSQKDFLIVFIWANSNTQDSVGRSSIAIDNFQINSANIKKPQNVVVYPHCEDSTLIVSWDPLNANTFDIQYRQVGEESWTHGTSGITEGDGGYTKDADGRCYFVLKRILEGSYDVRIRGGYEGSVLKTNYVYTSNILVYCPENHCVNYVDLYSPNVLCQYGHHPHVDTHSPYTYTGIIDFGPDAEESRHTLHVDPTEVDPRTDSLLHTVPDGALASVRLGNWKWGGEAEAITYDIVVDTTSQGILIVKYAVVFENPQGHPVEDEPAFNLEIMDSTNTVIDEICGQASFTYSSAVNDPEHWHMTADGKAAWKDWTTVGLSLMNYHNQHIKVRFTTLDCGYSGHYAYAYFTLDCANAHIETDNCGNDAQVTCIAPEGFAYEWRDENNVWQSNDQVFVPDGGIHTYTCKVSFVEEPSCFFEISTVSAPRFPVPDYTVEPLYGNCQSVLKFTNTSHVMNKFEGYENHTSEPCNEGHWVFRELKSGKVSSTTSWSPTYICPDEGDSIEVTYTCYIGANNSCDSTRVDTIVVPNIIPGDTTIYVQTCPESPYQFGDKWFEHDTVVVHTFKNFAGCDSTATLSLKVYPKSKDLYIIDSICSDQAIVIDGIRYNTPMDNKEFHLNTIHGCDSVIYMTLVVNERLRMEMDPFSFSCLDEEQLFISFDITAGVFDSLLIHFDTDQLRDTVIYDTYATNIAIPYSSSVTPGHYKATLSFYQFCCGVHTEVRDIDIRYPASIIEQKWNDVLTLLSPKYNGGYTFTAMQWYKDDMPLPGETHSYLYQPLDENSTYALELTREDGVVLKTCPIQPVHHEEQTAYPTVVKVGQRVPMYMEHPMTVWYFTTTGQLYGRYDLPQGYTDLPTPDQAGPYILKSVNTQGKTNAQVMIVE